MCEYNKCFGLCVLVFTVDQLEDNLQSIAVESVNAKFNKVPLGSFFHMVLFLYREKYVKFKAK